MAGMKLPGRAGRCILLMACLAGTSLFAAPVVIHDGGPTRPLAPLLEPLRSDDMQTDGSDPRSPSRPEPTPAPVSDEAILARLLPVRSPGLQVGALTDTELSPEVQTRLAQGNPRPFFMVGSDEGSIRWLSVNAKTLKDLGALGLLVQAETREDIRRVIEAAQGLSITPGSGSDLARVLGIRHYPVLITRDGITQ